MKLQFHINSRNTLQVALSGSNVEWCVSVHVHGRQGAASVQHQLGDVHAACVRRPVETHVQLLKRGTGLKWRTGLLWCADTNIFLLPLNLGHKQKCLNIQTQIWTQLNRDRTFKNIFTLSYFIDDGDVSSSVQQRSYHLHVFVLCSPDDWRPATAVLKETGRKEWIWASLVSRDSLFWNSARSFTCAFTSTCPVSISIFTISRFPSLAAWWRPVYPSSSWGTRMQKPDAEIKQPAAHFALTFHTTNRDSQCDRHRRHSGWGSAPPRCDCWWSPPTAASSGLCLGRPL